MALQVSVATTLLCYYSRKASTDKMNGHGFVYSKTLIMKTAGRPYLAHRPYIVCWSLTRTFETLLRNKVKIWTHSHEQGIEGKPTLTVICTDINLFSINRGKNLSFSLFFIYVHFLLGPLLSWSLSARVIQVLELWCKDSWDYFAIAKGSFPTYKIFYCYLYSICDFFHLSLSIIYLFLYLSIIMYTFKVNGWGDNEKSTT